MIRIPASYLRGLAVLTLGATLVLSHAALAAPQGGSSRSDAQTQMAELLGHDVVEQQQGTAGIELAENCYLEVQKHRTLQGKVVSRIVHECD
jgi:hypothetical protein